MARIEAEREDLMREATALVPRVELRIPGMNGVIIAGYRADGRVCFYFGAEGYYQFDARGGLRRAYVCERMYRTQGTKLAELTRERSESSTELRRRDLADEELDRFFETMHPHAAQLCDAIESGAAIVVRQVPTDASILPRLAQSLRTILTTKGRLAPAINSAR